MKNRPYHSEDITFCISECGRTSCYRHKSQMRDRGRNHSMTECKNTYLCPFSSDQDQEGRKINNRRKTL